jgi:hypothetical protein
MVLLCARAVRDGRVIFPTVDMLALRWTRLVPSGVHLPDTWTVRPLPSPQYPISVRCDGGGVRVCGHCFLHPGLTFTVKVYALTLPLARHRTYVLLRTMDRPRAYSSFLSPHFELLE